jgi:photosystem II protein
MKFLALVTLAPLAAAFAPTSSSLRSNLALNAEAEIQFVKGLAEKVVPDIKLTRARDGSSGVATFQFVSPNVFDASTAAQGDVTGMFMIDEEGEMSTTDVNAKFSNGKPQGKINCFLTAFPTIEMCTNFSGIDYLQQLNPHLS